MKDLPPSPDAMNLAAELLVSATLAATRPDEVPEPDWDDDHDIAILFLMSASVGLAALIGDRPDLGDGLLSGRYALRLTYDGVTLLEGNIAA